jgi:hypothetical protein
MSGAKGGEAGWLRRCALRDEANSGTGKGKGKAQMDGWMDVAGLDKAIGGTGQIYGSWAYKHTQTFLWLRVFVQQGFLISSSAKYV